MVVDTSDEIAGGGSVPHACIGAARRIPVLDRAKQGAVLLEAVQNHTPQVLAMRQDGFVRIASTRNQQGGGSSVFGTSCALFWRCSVQSTEKPELPTCHDESQYFMLVIISYFIWLSHYT